MHLPILRQGKPYRSLDTVEIRSVRTGAPVAAVSQANAGLIRRDLRRMEAAREALRAVPAEQLLAICARAGERFMEADLPLGPAEGGAPGVPPPSAGTLDGGTQSPDGYVEMLSATSGLPYALCRRNMAKIHQVLTQMPTILRGLTRGLDLEVLDRGIGEQAGVTVSFFPVTSALGVVLPSNSPGVNSLWIPAIPLKIPVVLKPGREEPWTPYRIIQAFIAAGAPAEAFSFYPTDHEGSGAILDGCGRALIFGDESTVARYAGNPAIQVHGPGRSKILIGDDCVDRWLEFVDLIVDSIAANGGRSCINASTVVVPRHADEIAAAVAARLARIQPLPAEAENAMLAGFANPKMAEWIDAAIEDGLAADGAVEVTAPHREGPRCVTRDGSTYLLPTLVRCRSFDHPLANREFLFPYASVVEVPQAQMLETIGPSLVVTALTEDARFIESLIASPLIERLNLGPLPTTHVQWDQPHEGNLFDFLYRRRAIQRA
jgi:acyl-CoA reductase-like NAD-dependent aldehyde dehydrogenase